MGCKEGLNISPHKTAIVPFINKRKVGDLRSLTLHGKKLKMLGEVKYLGVILDTKLNWNQHLQKIIRKAQTTFVVVRRMCGKKWGLSPNMVPWLYTRVITPSILHALVWWPKVKQKTTKIQLGTTQGMACLAITGAMKSNPTAPMEVLLNLTPLDLLIMAEARMALYRLHILRQLSVPNTVSGLLTIWKNVGDPLLDMWWDYTIPVYRHSKIFNVITDQDYWRNKDPVFPEDTLIWFTDSSRSDSGTGSGIFGTRPNRSFSFPLGKFGSFSNQNICHSSMCM
jgi:hypothetical protein